MSSPRLDLPLCRDRDYHGLCVHSSYFTRKRISLSFHLSALLIRSRVIYFIVTSFYTLQYIHGGVRLFRGSRPFFVCPTKTYTLAVATLMRSRTPPTQPNIVVNSHHEHGRYDGEDCSAAVELKPQKPLPAITTFFKKKSKSPPRSPSSSSGAADVKTETRWTENGEAVGSDLERNGQASSASTTTTTMNSRWEAGAVQGTLDRGCKGVANEAGSPIVPKRMRCDAAELVDLTENDDCSLRVAVSNQPLLPPSFGLKHPRMWKGRQEDVTTPTRQAESDRGQRSPTQAARNPKKARKGKSGGDGSGKRSPGNGGGSPAGRDKNQPNLMSFFQPNG